MLVIAPYGAFLLKLVFTPSQRAEDICRLCEKGLSPDQIAERLKITRNAVMAYLPYNRGYQLGGNKSANALRIRACRERKKTNNGQTGNDQNGGSQL